MISANGGLPAHRYTPQVTPRWPRGSEPASMGARGVGVGTRPLFRRARSCELALLGAAAVQGGPWGGASCLDVGPPGSGALPRPTARP